MGRLNISRKSGEAVHLFVNGEEIVMTVNRVDHRTPPSAQISFDASRNVLIERAERLKNTNYKARVEV